MDDLKIEIFCEGASSESQLAVCCASDRANCLFTRNLKGFMLQTGDPLVRIACGESIWGRHFADKIKTSLRPICIELLYSTLLDEHKSAKRTRYRFDGHNGPDTNGSHFFILYSKQPHIDSNHTVFGK
ncbi:peptidylprolyl isomerase-like 3, isoform CRA_a [Cladochytrium replicatum]|nr:peptidylprolyl isomerase-like 3, isoform CRA_a [Cladochytrium replicatum]